MKEKSWFSFGSPSLIHLDGFYQKKKKEKEQNNQLKRAADNDWVRPFRIFLTNAIYQV